MGQCVTEKASTFRIWRGAVSLSLAVMHCSVTCRTKRNQVLLRIVAGLAAKFFVMNLEIRHRAARLASPAVATEHLVAKLFVRLGLKPHGRSLWSDQIHNTFSAT
jgi:hypothetical protein